MLFGLKYVRMTICLIAGLLDQRRPRPSREFDSSARHVVT